MKTRTWAAIGIGKLAGKASRALGRGGGTALPGLLALRVDAQLVSTLCAQIPRGSVLITGTNGKTTTARIIAAILRRAGFAPLHNKEGSNLMRGIATALIERARWLGALDGKENTIGLFEVDEATLPQAIAEIQPRVVAITNLFRDQLDRYGEVDRVASLWAQALRALPSGAALVLNSDDPKVAALGKGFGNTLYFGIEDTKLGRSALEHAADSQWCPDCGIDYHYEISYYGHLGHYQCPRCGWSRPSPHIKVERISLKGFSSSELEVLTPHGKVKLEFGLPGIYNTYNALAALTVALALEVPLATAAQGVGELTAAFGRVERVEIEGRTAYLILVKNPVGLNAVLRTLLAQEAMFHILFILNDGIADGRDVSWIWDADLENLAGRVRLCIASGTRAEDMALRLKYAGVEDEPRSTLEVERDLGRALAKALHHTPPGEPLYILPTYTAMLNLRGILAHQGHLRQYWEIE